MFRRARFLASLVLALSACSEHAPDLTGPISGWDAYGNDIGGSRFSRLTQITPENVGELELAWIHRSGDVLDGSASLGKSSLQVTPIIAGGSLVYCSPRNRVFALDPETGAERWRFDPEVDASNFYIINCRGVSAWTDPALPYEAACSERILMGTIDARLIALDAKTGRPCAGFGANGEVDLTAGIGDIRPGEYGVTSPPVIVRDRIVTGAMVLDDRRVDSPGGVVRAFDVRTGALAWVWEPVLPEQLGAAAGGSGFRRGTTNAWSALSADAERGLVFVPTGNTSPDYYGGHRNGLDYFSSSVVALDANDGHVVWNFQTVHHDIWDYDIASQPVLFDFHGPNGRVPGLIAPTKLGMLFFLNRETGVPLFPVEERAVPQTGLVPGEYLSATQPFTTKPEPLHPHTLTPDDAFGFTPYDKAVCRREIESLRHDGIFTPPSLEGSVQYPGMIGGMNWGSVAIDPQRRLVIANTQRIATKIRLVPQTELAKRYPDGPPAYGYEPQAGSPYFLERTPLLSPFGAPCNAPPWGTLAAIDTTTGEKKWEVTLGTTRDLAPWPIWLPLGTPNLGGPLTTASGLIFIGATTDFYVRAFETETGEELWRRRLPTSAHSTPMTYRLRPNGRQFVVIAAGGHGILQTPPSDALMAFALPE